MKNVIRIEMIIFESIFPFADRCQIPYLFYSSPLGTWSYNTEETGGSPMMFNNRASALVSFDGVNKLVYFYTGNEGITKYYLNGSSSMTININNVEVFAVDGRRNVIYYHHELRDRIWIYNMTSGENVAENNLENVASIKDLDMDYKNG